MSYHQAMRDPVKQEYVKHIAERVGTTWMSHLITQCMGHSRLKTKEN